MAPQTTLVARLGGSVNTWVAIAPMENGLPVLYEDFQNHMLRRLDASATRERLEAEMESLVPHCYIRKDEPPNWAHFLQAPHTLLWEAHNVEDPSVGVCAMLGVGKIYVPVGDLQFPESEKAIKENTDKYTVIGLRKMHRKAVKVPSMELHECDPSPVTLKEALARANLFMEMGVPSVREQALAKKARAKETRKVKQMLDTAMAEKKDMAVQTEAQESTGSSHVFVAEGFVAEVMAAISGSAAPLMIEDEEETSKKRKSSGSKKRKSSKIVA